MKNYEKPIASFLAFYSEKDLASEQSIADYTDVNANGESANVGTGGSKPDNWD